MDAMEIKPNIYRVTHKRLWWEGKAVNASDAKKQATKRFNGMARSRAECPSRVEGVLPATGAKQGYRKRRRDREGTGGDEAVE